MIFNSVEYGLFLALVMLLYWVMAPRFRWVLLLIASYAFYMRWNPYYAVLILTTTVISYASARALADARSATTGRLLMLAGVGSTLGLLIVFKYWNFFNESARNMSAALGVAWQVPDLAVLLPVGISFYTFQTLGYVVDVHRRQFAPETHLGRFALYVAFFPQLVAGPIERAGNLLPQIRTTHEFNFERVCAGLQLVLWGLFKKVVIADRLAIYVDTVYSNVPAHDPASYVLATYAFAIQIYCDFSGYTDMAIGSANALGFRLMQNFRSPYSAVSIRDFWRRWHISLSTWLRDYLYIPLGGNQRGVPRMYTNLMITMLLGGLWHGASWNFLIWGAIHGVLLAASRASQSLRDRLYLRAGVASHVRDAVRIFLTFQLVCIAWVFFRAATLGDSLAILAGLFGPWKLPLIDASVFTHAAIGLAVLLAAEIYERRHGSVLQGISALRFPLRWALWYALLLAIALLGVDGGSQFIYFQF